MPSRRRSGLVGLLDRVRVRLGLDGLGGRLEHLGEVDHRVAGGHQGRLGAADDDAVAVGVDQPHPLAEGVEEPAEALALSPDVLAGREDVAAAALLLLGAALTRFGASSYVPTAGGVRHGLALLECGAQGSAFW